MKTKIYYLLLLCLMVLGRGEVWADVVTFDFNDKLKGISSVKNTSTTVESYPITLTFTSVNDSRLVQFNQNAGTIKFQGPSGDDSGTSLTVSCPTSGLYAITQVEIFTNKSDIDKFSNSAGSYSTAATTGDDASVSSYKGTWTDGNAGNISEVTFTTTSNVVDVKAFKITYTDNRTPLTTFAFNSDEVYIHDGTGSGGTYVNGTTFVYDASKTTLRTKLNIDPSLSTIGASSNSTYFTVTSSNSSVLNVSGTLAYSDANSGTRVYIDGIQVAGIGDATLTFTFAGTSTYKGKTIDVPIRVIDHSITLFNNSYRYTWDFTGDWTSTIAQLGYGNGSGGYNWTKTVDATHAEARPTYHTAFTANDIDMIKGLAFTTSNVGDLCLDWFEGRKAIWMANAATVTIPNLVVGQVVTITADGNNFRIPDDSPGSASQDGNVFTVTKAGNLKITMTADTRISSIAVSNASYGWSYTTTETTLDKARKTSGTFTFTESGPITGGIVIDEVPGITMKVGAAGDTWEVVEGNGDVNPDFYLDATHKWNIGYAAVCKTEPNDDRNPTSGCFYQFNPVVNGELILNYYTVDGASVCEIQGGNPQARKNDDNRIQSLTVMVEAGKTYKLKTALGKTKFLWLHSFTFRPVFFNPSTSKTDQLTVGDFDANMNTEKSAFPKLINPSSTAQQEKVKFAGDKTKVYLYKNNDVDLLGAGEDILIRGTVLDKNNEDGLVAYYYLNSQIISLKSTELEDQAYISSGGLTSDNYTFTYDGNVVANGGTLTVKVKKDTGEENNVIATVNSYDGDNDETTIDVPFASLDEGATYRIRIPANTLQLSSAAEVKNSEVVRTFSVNGDNEAHVKMTYPIGMATVGTTIVLDTYILDGEGEETKTDVVVSNSPRVKGVLSGGTQSDMEITASFSANELVFKPSRTLEPNTTYTLTITTTYNGADNKISLTGDYSAYKVTHDKVFTFMTGSSSGSVPTVVSYSPTQDSEVDASAYYNSGRIEFTFDQAVELEPFSIVNAVPVNGGNKTAGGETKGLVLSDGELIPDPTNTLRIDDDNKTVYFTYSKDQIKYDLYYEVTIPANTVVGAGGLPNSSPIVLKFKMGMHPKATEVNVSTFYPHTWDFNKLGQLTASNTSTSTADLLAKHAPSHYNNSTGNCMVVDYDDITKNQVQYVKYISKRNATYGFDQGNDIYIATSDNSISDKLPEFEGIRVSLNSKDGGRFEIRDENLRNVATKWNESGVATSWEIQETGAALNLDGSHKYIFRMNGNTHYMTISNVPRGKLYMVVNAKHLGINSPNATFEAVAGATITNNNTLMNTNGNKKVVINVVPTNDKDYEDVSFCVQDFNCEKIGVATESKPITAVGYATNARSYPVDYTLNKTFTGEELTAYKVTGVSGSNAIATEVKYVPAGDGVMLKAAGGDNVSYPMFTWDYNQWSSDMDRNRLKGVINGEFASALPQKSGNNYNYILSTGGVNVKYNYEGSIEDIENQTGTFGGYVSGLAFYLVMKEGTILENGTAYVYEKPKSNSAYLQLDSYLARQTGTGTESGARQYFLIDFGDETTSVIGIGDTSKPSMSDDLWFSLQGVRVEKPGKGLYIRKGKKIVMK